MRFEWMLRRIRRALSLIVAIGSCTWMLTACVNPDSAATPVHYVTHYGLGPDKWATAWLLTRHVDPTGKLIVEDPAADLPAGVVFDEPSSPLRRIENRSAFEVTKTQYQLDAPVLDALVALVHEIEINFWNFDGAPEAAMGEMRTFSVSLSDNRDFETFLFTQGEIRDVPVNAPTGHELRGIAGVARGVPGIWRGRGGANVDANGVAVVLNLRFSGRQRGLNRIRSDRTQ